MRTSEPLTSTALGALVLVGLPSTVHCGAPPISLSVSITARVPSSSKAAKPQPMVSRMRSLACLTAAAGMSAARGARVHSASFSIARGPFGACGFFAMATSLVSGEHCPGAASGEMAEHHVAGLPGAGRVVVEEQSDHGAGGVEALDRLVAGVDHARLRVDLDAAEAEGDAAGHRIGAERPLHDRHRPVRFLRRD